MHGGGELGKYKCSHMHFFFFFKTQESAHYHCDMSAYIVKSGIKDRSNMGPLHKTLIILKVDRYYGLFHWKRGFTVHFGLKKKKKGKE